MKKFYFNFLLILFLFLSFNVSLASWNENIPSGKRNWRQITSSYDLNKMAAVVYDGFIYTSNNFGNTWIARTSAGQRNWWSIDSSSDGNKLVAGVNGGYLYISNDGGITWTAKTSLGSKSWIAVDYVDNANKIIAYGGTGGLGAGGSIYISNDGGATFAEQTNLPKKDYLGITSSSDGNKIALAAYGDYVYTSNDGGATWTTRTSAGKRNWGGIASSSDGNKLIASVSTNGAVYISENFGSSWRSTLFSNFWRYVASSSDGNKLVALNSDKAYHSNDGGLNWEAHDYMANIDWRGLTSSNDGYRLAATNFENYVYLFQDTTPPTMTLSATPQNVNYGSASQLTWTSTNTTNCVASGGWSGNKTSQGSQLTSLLTTDTTFTLTCTGPGGTIEDSVLVTVNPEAPVVNLGAVPVQIGQGSDVTLTWTVQNATSCNADSSPNNVNWSGDKDSNGGNVILNLNQTTTFTLTCTGAGGESSASVIVTVNPSPVVSLSANPQNVNYGGGSQLTWTVSNATTCSASGGWTGNKSVSGGSQLILSITETTVYTLTCVGVGGSTSISETISVNPQAPVVDLSANPISVQNGGSTTLSWATQNATTCSASDGWTGSKALSGTEIISNITVNTVFSLTCTGLGGETENFVNVSVLGKPIVSLIADPTSVFPGGSTTLSWTSQNATTCNASSNPVGLWQGNKNTSGDQVVSGIPGATTFTLTCSGPGGESISYANVSQIEERITFRNTRVINGRTVLSWTLKNVKNCKASTRNPDSGLNWEGDIPNEPTTGQRSNVIVNAPDTTKQEEKNEYILTCNGTYSGEEVSISLFLDINDPASSGTKIPKYNEN